MAEGLIVEDIWKGDVKGVKVNGARNIDQGHRQATCSPYNEEKLYARFGGCRPNS